MEPRSKWSVSLAVLAMIMTTVGSPGTSTATSDDVSTPNMRLEHHDPFLNATNIGLLPNGVVVGSMDVAGMPQDAGLRVYGLQDPSHPRLRAFRHCASKDNFVAVLRDIVVQAVQKRNDGACDPQARDSIGVRIWDVSERSDPRVIGFVPARNGAHTLTALPQHNLVYMSMTSGPFMVIDLADPRAPKVTRMNYATSNSITSPPPDPTLPTMENRAGTDPLAGCHEIGIHPSLPRAYCASVHEVQVWDITDPRKPVILNIFVNPKITHHHSAEVSPDGRTLVVTDEAAFGIASSSACDTPNSEVGAVWFYDISANPDRPVELSHWAPAEVLPDGMVCYAHNFGFFDDRPWMAVAWWEQGVFVLDFAKPSQPRMVGRYRPAGAALWDAKVHKGRIYASSMAPALPADTVLNTQPTPLSPTAGGLFVFSLDGYGR